jgi:GNAT superfamily N-acetyltransferase
MENFNIEHSHSLSKSEQSLIDREWDAYDRNLYGPEYNSYAWDREKQHYKAYVNGVLVGIAALEIEGGVVVLDELIVIEAHRSKGVGTAMLEQVIEMAEQKKCHKITLETHPKLRAIELYKKKGFQQEGILRNHFGHEDYVLMSKYLTWR